MVDPIDYIKVRLLSVMVLVILPDKIAQHAAIFSDGICEGSS